MFTYFFAKQKNKTKNNLRLRSGFAVSVNVIFCGAKNDLWLRSEFAVSANFIFGEAKNKSTITKQVRSFCERYFLRMFTYFFASQKNKTKNNLR